MDSAPLPTLELLVMLAVMRLGDGAYPPAIRDEIEARSGKAASRAAVFITLERLERKGLLTSRFGDPTAVRGGRAKRFFSPLPQGVMAVKASLAAVDAMSHGLEALVVGK